MQTLRQARFLARCVLAWFVLSLGVAVASPLVKPQGLELVCASGGALKLVVTDDIGVQAETGQTGAMNLLGHTLDCPLCANLGAPPQVIGAALAPVPGLSSALHPIAATHIPGRTAAPMFARGPPARA